MIYPDGYKRIRWRNVTNVRRRLEKLENGYEQGTIAFAHARGSIASWLGLAKYASAFRLSRELFEKHDVRNIGKRLLVKMVGQKKLDSVHATHRPTREKRIRQGQETRCL